MTQATTLPGQSIPDDVEDQLEQRLRQPSDPATGQWLLELIKNSGHLSSSDDLRWRAFSMVWLAFEYDVDQAWPYLMWLNMGEPSIAPHLSEILIEAIDNFAAQVKMANWLSHAEDERLLLFFQDFRPVPAHRKIQPLFGSLMVEPTKAETGVWLASFCRDTASDTSADMRPWRLLAAAWYASTFEPAGGLEYLHRLIGDRQVLSAADNKLLMDAANKVNGLTPMTQLIADCSDPAVRTMLKEFGHPELPELAEAILQSQPDYKQLPDPSVQASLDADTFRQSLVCLEEERRLANKSRILDLACGPLASQTLLFTSVGYKTIGVDLVIPPGYLPVNGARQWLRRKQHNKAWQAATQPYYQALAQQAKVKFKWNKVKIRLADLTRLDMADSSFDVVVCFNHLQHAPDVDGLLAEVARVLKPDGLFLADIRPYAFLHGPLQDEAGSPWRHLREDRPAPTTPLPALNKWREAQFRDTFERYFAVEQWLLEKDEEARLQLTPHIRAELDKYSEDELTGRRIVVVARRL